MRKEGKPHGNKYKRYTGPYNPWYGIVEGALYSA
jgi:hypothetical protein